MPGRQQPGHQLGRLAADAGVPGRQRREPQQHQRAHHLALDLGTGARRRASGPAIAAAARASRPGCGGWPARRTRWRCRTPGRAPPPAPRPPRAPSRSPPPRRRSARPARRPAATATTSSIEQRPDVYLHRHGCPSNSADGRAAGVAAGELSRMRDCARWSAEGAQRVSRNQGTTGAPWARCRPRRKTLRVLRFLASQPEPTSIDRIMRACELPRSTAYHLLTAMAEEGFVVHLAEEHRWGLGVAAFEVGSGYTRQEPLQRIARRLLADLADRTRQSAHLAVLHGRDVLYVVEERAPGRPPLVTDVGVRLPAHLTASGRAILAALPAAQVRALYPDAEAFVDRHGTGPAHPQPAAGAAHRHPAARLRDRGGRGHPRARERGRPPCSTTTATPSRAWPSPTPTATPRRARRRRTPDGRCPHQTPRWAGPRVTPGRRVSARSGPQAARPGVRERTTARGSSSSRLTPIAAQRCQRVAAATVSSDSPSNSSSSDSRNADDRGRQRLAEGVAHDRVPGERVVASRSDCGSRSIPRDVSCLRGQHRRVDVDRLGQRRARRQPGQTGRDHAREHQVRVGGQVEALHLEVGRGRGRAGRAGDHAQRRPRGSPGPSRRTAPAQCDGHEPQVARRRRARRPPAARGRWASTPAANASPSAVSPSAPARPPSGSRRRATATRARARRCRRAGDHLRRERRAQPVPCDDRADGLPHQHGACPRPQTGSSAATETSNWPAAYSGWSCSTSHALRPPARPAGRRRSPTARPAGPSRTPGPRTAGHEVVVAASLADAHSISIAILHGRCPCCGRVATMRRSSSRLQLVVRRAVLLVAVDRRPRPAGLRGERRPARSQVGHQPQVAVRAAGRRRRW